MGKIKGRSYVELACLYARVLVAGRVFGAACSNVGACNCECAMHRHEFHICPPAATAVTCGIQALKCSNCAEDLVEFPIGR